MSAEILPVNITNRIHVPHRPSKRGSLTFIHKAQFAIILKHMR